MSEHIKDGYLFFLSERFDDNFKQLGTKRILGSTNIHQRNSTFEEKRSEIYNFLESFISIDDRFNSLRQFLGHDEANNLEDLMTFFSNERYRDELGITYFFAKVAKFLMSNNARGIEESTRVDFNNQVIELTRLCFEKDVLLMYAKNDSSIANDIKLEMEQMNISVDLQEDVGIGKTVFSILEDGFKKYMLVFVIATENLQDDGIKKFLAEGQLFTSLKDKQNRLIPVTVEGKPFDSSVFGQLNPWVFKSDRSRNTLEAVIQATTDKVFNL